MIHSIENDYLQLSVKQVGAEMCSIKSIKSGKQYLWNGDAAFWANHAPVLFPIVGSLKEGKYFYQNREYTLPSHGFMRYNKNVEMHEKTDNSLTFLLKSNEESLNNYPFDFEFYTTFRLDSNKISITHKVCNQSDKEMYFSVGAHPAFKCPVNENEHYTDYYLEFENIENAVSYGSSNGLILNETKNVFEKLANNNKQSIVDLHPQLFNDGALVFKDLKSESISIKSRKSNQVVKVTFRGFPYMGIWAKPNAPFICIEPWLGIADGIDADQKIENKEGIVCLTPNEVFEAAYNIEIFE